MKRTVILLGLIVVIVAIAWAAADSWVKTGNLYLMTGWIKWGGTYASPEAILFNPNTGLLYSPGHVQAATNVLAGGNLYANIVQATDEIRGVNIFTDTEKVFRILRTQSPQATNTVAPTPTATETGKTNTPTPTGEWSTPTVTPTSTATGSHTPVPTIETWYNTAQGDEFGRYLYYEMLIADDSAPTPVANQVMIKVRRTPIAWWDAEGDVHLDDGSGASPMLIGTDGANHYFQLYKQYNAYAVLDHDQGYGLRVDDNFVVGPNPTPKLITVDGGDIVAQDDIEAGDDVYVYGDIVQDDNSGASGTHRWIDGGNDYIDAYLAYANWFILDHNQGSRGVSVQDNLRIGVNPTPKWITVDGGELLVKGAGEIQAGLHVGTQFRVYGTPTPMITLGNDGGGSIAGSLGVNGDVVVGGDIIGTTFPSTNLNVKIIDPNGYGDYTTISAWESGETGTTSVPAIGVLVPATHSLSSAVVKPYETLVGLNRDSTYIDVTGTLELRQPASLLNVTITRSVQGTAGTCINLSNGDAIVAATGHRTLVENVHFAFDDIPWQENGDGGIVTALLTTGTTYDATYEIRNCSYRGKGLFMMDRYGSAKYGKIQNCYIDIINDGTGPADPAVAIYKSSPGTLEIRNSHISNNQAGGTFDGTIHGCVYLNNGDLSVGETNSATVENCFLELYPSTTGSHADVQVRVQSASSEAYVTGCQFVGDANVDVQLEENAIGTITWMGCDGVHTVTGATEISRGNATFADVVIDDDLTVTNDTVIGGGLQVGDSGDTLTHTYMAHDFNLWTNGVETWELAPPGAVIAGICAGPETAGATKECYLGLPYAPGTVIKEITFRYWWHASAGASDIIAYALVKQAQSDGTTTDIARGCDNGGGGTGFDSATLSCAYTVESGYSIYVEVELNDTITTYGVFRDFSVVREERKY